MFTLVDRGSDQRLVVPAKSADESTVRLLHDNHEEESLTVYTDGFRAYDPLDDDEDFQRGSVITARENTSMETHTSTPARATRRWCDGGSHRIEVSQKTS